MSRRVLRGFDRHEFKRLRLSWRGQGMSAHDLGRLSGLGDATVHKWENGEHAPNIDKLIVALAVIEAPVSAVVRIPADERTLADLRNLAGLTQPQLAKAAGLSTTSLSSLERGGSTMTEAKTAVLAPLLGVTTAEIAEAWQRAKTRPPGAPA